MLPGQFLWKNWYFEDTVKHLNRQKEEGNSSGGNKDADRWAYEMRITVSMKDHQCEMAQKYPWITVDCYPNLPEDGSSPPSGHSPPVLPPPVHSPTLAGPQHCSG